MLRSTLPRLTAHSAAVAVVFGFLSAGHALAQTQRDSVLRTMTGPARRTEQPTGNASLLAAPVVTESPVVTLGQLLSGRFVGLQVMSTGASGTGSRIRIRGQSSLVLGNDPLIVIDGIRLLQAPTDDAKPTPSRVDDLNIDDIEEIEILSGPASATLYGTGAANGVINITTKRGTFGKTRFSASAETGLVTDPAIYPDLWQLWGKRTGQTVSSSCSLTLVAALGCSIDSLSHGNVLNIDSLTPIGQGFRSRYGLQVSGGKRRVQFFVLGERGDETGVFRMPARDVAQLEAERSVSAVPKNQRRPSALSRNSVRVNLSAQPTSMLSLQLTSAWVNGDTRLLMSDESGNGLGYNATGGTWLRGSRDALGRPLAGYATASPGDVMSQSTTQSIDRYVNGASAVFSARRWLAVRGFYGRDDATQVDGFVVRNGEGPIANGRAGYASRMRTIFGNQNAVLSATGTFHATSWLTGRTSIGAEYITNKSTTDSRVGSELPAGATTPEAGTSRSSSFRSIESQSTAAFLHQEFALHNTLFVTGGVRRDQISAYGSDVDAAVYPSVGVSWVLSEHAVLAKRSWLNTLRLRSGYGTSGQAPGPGNGVDPISIGAIASVSGYKTEYSAEWESGADVKTFGGASDLALSYYRRKTTEVLIPINGSFSGLRYANPGGEVRNSGIELSLFQRLVNRPQFLVAVTVVGATNKNRLVSLPADAAPVFTGSRTTQKNTPGYPLFGFWGRTYSFADANNDGIITGNELTFSDTAQFIASSFPTRVLALSPSVELFNHKLRFTAQLDSKWGFRKFNNTLRHQCQSSASCQARNDRSASLADQAAAVAILQNGTLTGMIEDGSFRRLREASALFELPPRWVSAIHAASGNIVVSGRNLGVTTNYSGIDPEASVSTGDARQDEYFSTPLARYYTVRLNVRF